MSGPVRRQAAKKPLDHAADALLALERAEQALARIDLERLSPRQQQRVNTLRKSVAASMAACVNCVDTLLDSPTPRRSPLTSPSSK